MKRALALLSLPVLLASATIADAQGIGLSFQGRYGSGGFYIGGAGPGIYRANVGFGPSPVSYGGGANYYAPPYTSVTIYSPSQPRPVVVMQPPPPVVNAPVNNGADLRDEDFPDKIIIRPGQRAVRGGVREPPPPLPREPEPMLPPGEPAGNFRPIRPEDRDRVKPAPDDRPAPADAAPGFGPLPAMPADRPVLADPKLPAHEQFISLGKQAFAEREYGRAADRFRQALAVAPDHSPALFLLAQSQFGLGKYREAVATIHAGLRLNPIWPTSRFKVRELYGAQPDAFTEQVALLEQTLQRHPNDPALLFLYGYELWFSGRQDDAKPYFQRALPLVVEPRFIQMFLQAHNGPVVAR